MIKYILTGMLVISVAHSYMPTVNKYDPIQKEGLAYYYGQGKKQNFANAKERFSLSCSVGYEKSCEKLADIYAGVTPKVEKSAFKAKVDLEKLRNTNTQSYYYFQAFSPFEMFSRQIVLPKSDRWRLSMKLYLLYNDELGGSSRYVVVADVIENKSGKTVITRYSTVYGTVPMGGGLMENEYIAVNDLSGQSYPCGAYKNCSDLNAAVFSNGLVVKGKHVGLEKAPWEKTPTLPSSLIRAMEYMMYDLKKNAPREINGENQTTWEYSLGENISKEMHSKHVLTLTLDKNGEEFVVAAQKEHSTDVLQKEGLVFRYHSGDKTISAHRQIKEKK